MAMARPRDGMGNVIFHPFIRPGDDQIHASDAKFIGELDSTILSADNKDQLSTQSERLVISTPNADYLPHVNLGRQVVSVCKDGRWGAEDWGQWPQWYFDGQAHFAYVLRKPSTSELSGHPLRRLWWNATENDWQQDAGLNYGLLSSHITEEFYEIRTRLMKEVEDCVCHDGRDYQKIHQIAGNMRQCISTLRFTPQPFLSVLLTVTAAQRYCLEVKAMVDMIKSEGTPLPLTETHFPASNKYLGCVTDRIPILYKMYEKGIPVWYVRPLSAVSATTNIIAQCIVIRPAQAGIETKRWPGAPIFYEGRLSREIHASIQDWKPGNLQLNLLDRSCGSEQDSTSASTFIQPQEPVPGSKASEPSSSKSNRVQPYSKIRAVEAVAAKKPHISVNRELFVELDSSCMSQPLEVWKKALGSVQVDTNRIIQHPNSHLFRGYAFPPPRTLGGDSEQSLEHALGWLVVRTAWLGDIGASKSRSTPLPTPQQWRTYLRNVALDLELVRSDSRKKAASAPTQELSHSTRRGAKSKAAAKEIFTIRVPTQKALRVIFWHNQIIWSLCNKVDFPNLHRRLLVWDAQEHNFRLELLTLDQHIMAEARQTTEGKVLRNAKVSAVWPDGVILNAELPDKSSGIAATDWQVRCPFVEAFRAVIADWPGDIPKQLLELSCKRRLDNGNETWDRPLMERIEHLAATHYCQTFFDHFGRAPCIPHVLPG